VDGVALDPERLRSWRDRIGYVPQDTFLFHDTVLANLLWARPDAGLDEVWRALTLAVADDFVRGLPDGLDTIVGDRGMLVSGGERQRLSLARALLRQPQLLILDEATSALDSESERRIQQAIDRLHGQITIVVIAHRLSTIRNADLIHVIERGDIVESGRWADLAARPGGRLRTLCQAQGIDPDAALQPESNGARAEFVVPTPAVFSPAPTDMRLSQGGARTAQGAATGWSHRSGGG
jgi:ATP-binding cassette subfamily C protein